MSEFNKRNVNHIEQKKTGVYKNLLTGVFIYFHIGLIGSFRSNHSKSY